MSVGLAAIVARARLVVASLTPATGTARFVVIGRDLPVEATPRTSHRRFEVAEKVAPPVLTRTMLGIDGGQFRGGFRVTVLYDASADFPAMRAAMSEDAEQITFAVEMDAAYPAGTRMVERSGEGSIEAFEGGFAQLTLDFQAIYERTF